MDAEETPVIEPEDDEESLREKGFTEEQIKHIIAMRRELMIGDVLEETDHGELETTTNGSD